jgi:hypothetical protein
MTAGAGEGLAQQGAAWAIAEKKQAARFAYRFLSSRDLGELVFLLLRQPRSVAVQAGQAGDIGLHS